MHRQNANHRNKLLDMDEVMRKKYFTWGHIEGLIFSVLLVYLIGFVETSFNNLILVVLIGYLFDKVRRLNRIVARFDSCSADKSSGV